MGNDPIVIAFCVSDSFIRHTAVVIASVLASNPGERFVFHVLCGDLSQDGRTRLGAMAGPRADVVFHDVTSGEAEGCPVLMEHLSREAYFRYLIPELIDAPRVIYSDVDVLVRGALRPLWETDLRGCPIGAVQEACDASPTPSAQWRVYRKGLFLFRVAADGLRPPPRGKGRGAPLRGDAAMREDALRGVLRGLRPSGHQPCLPRAHPAIAKALLHDQGDAPAVPA